MDRPHHDLDLTWTTEALAKLQKVPFFARSQVKSKVEQIARAQWVEVITVEVIEQARVEFGQ